PFGLTHVAVPGNCVRVLAQTRRFQFAHGAAPQVVIVVDDPDLCFYSGAFKRRTELSANEIGFVFLGPTASRHAAVLVGIDFVLNGDGLYRDTFSLITLQELNKI